MQPPSSGVTVAPELCRPLALLARLGARKFDADNGGVRLAPAMARLLRDLDDAAVSARGTPAAKVVPQPGQLTTAQAAAVMGITTRRVRQLAATGHIIARKTGRDWHVDEQAANDWRHRQCPYR